MSTGLTKRLISSRILRYSVIHLFSYRESLVEDSPHPHENSYYLYRLMSLHFVMQPSFLHLPSPVFSTNLSNGTLIRPTTTVATFQVSTFRHIVNLENTIPDLQCKPNTRDRLLYITAHYDSNFRFITVYCTNVLFPRHTCGRATFPSLPYCARYTNFRCRRYCKSPRRTIIIIADRMAISVNLSSRKCSISLRSLAMDPIANLRFRAASIC